MLVDGDQGFIGLNTSDDPALLKEGMLKGAQNVRIEDARVLPRDCCEPVIPTTPANAFYGTTEKALVAGTYLADANDEYHVVVTGTATYFYRPSDGDTQTIGYPMAVTVTDVGMTLLQAYDKLFLFRTGQSALEWDGNFANDWAEVDHTDQVSSVTNMPSGAGFAAYHQSRVILPRIGTDAAEVVFSDVLDSDSYTVTNRFLLNTGGGDRVTAIHPYTSESVIVFTRKKVWLIQNISDLTQATVQLVNPEFGCVNSRCVVTVGPSVIFVSDYGVMQLEITTELNARPVARPLSEPVENIFRAIGDFSKCTLGFADNRLLFAFADGTELNAYRYLTFNFENMQWESLNLLPTGVSVRDIYVARKANKLRAVFSSADHGPHWLQTKTNSTTDTVYSIAGEGTADTTVTFSCDTRHYRFGTTRLKQLKRTFLGVQNLSQTEGIDFVIEDTDDIDFVAGFAVTWSGRVSMFQPDSVRDLDNDVVLSGDTRQYRALFVDRGTEFSLRWTPLGRALLRYVQFEATPSVFDHFLPFN